MNKKLTITLDAICNDKSYSFTLPYGDTFDHVSQALRHFAEDLAAWEKEIIAQQEAQKAEKPVVEEPIVVQPEPESAG